MLPLSLFVTLVTPPTLYTPCCSCLLTKQVSRQHFSKVRLSLKWSLQYARCCTFFSLLDQNLPTISVLRRHSNEVNTLHLKLKSLSWMTYTSSKSSISFVSPNGNIFMHSYEMNELSTKIMDNRRMVYVPHRLWGINTKRIVMKCFSYCLCFLLFLRFTSAHF